MNLLIVNDEKLTAETMKENIIWDAYGIDEVYTAYDAGRAKKAIVEKQIDVMLCDIEMPGENGISLLDWVRNEGYEIECIFLTCHANFMYAKEAISLGCQDYLLVPVKYEVIGAAILKVVERISRKRDDIRYQLLGKELFFDKIKQIEEKKSEKKTTKEVISEISGYIIEHISDTNLSVNEIAEKFFFHPVYLNRVFKKERNVSVGQFIINCRMKMATSLLIDGKLSVNEVAEQVGYKYYTNFHNIFKKKYGCVPSQYKRDR